MPIINLYDNNHTGSVAQITFTSNLGGSPYVIGNFQIPYAFDSDILPGGYYFGTYSLFYSQWGQTCTIQILPPDTPTPTPTNTQTPTQTPTNTQTSTQTSTPNKSPSQTPTHTPTPTNTTTQTPTQTQTPTNTNTPTNTQTPTLTQTPTQTGAICCAPIITNIVEESTQADCLAGRTRVRIYYSLPTGCANACNGFLVETSSDGINFTILGQFFGTPYCTLSSLQILLPYVESTVYIRLIGSCTNSTSSSPSNVTFICRECYEYQVINNSGAGIGLTYEPCDSCIPINVPLANGQQTQFCFKNGTFSMSGQGTIIPKGGCTTSNCPCDIVFSAVIQQF